MCKHVQQPSLRGWVWSNFLSGHVPSVSRRPAPSTRWPLHCGMATQVVDEWAAHAARLVVDEGLSYGQAKRKAARAMGLERARQMPNNEQVEDAVREHLSIFYAETQPRDLRVMRELASQWMRRLAHLNPYLSHAVWRGTATRHSQICIELYADDPKMAEIHLLNLGIHDQAPSDQDDGVVLIHETFNQTLSTPVAIQFVVLDADALRGALKTDARGRTWRGDLAALERMIALSTAQDEIQPSTGHG